MIDAVIFRPPPHQLPAQAGAHAAIGVVDRLRLSLRNDGMTEVQRILQGRRMIDRRLLRCHATRLRDRNNQERVHSRARPKSVVPATQFAKRAHAHLRQAFAYFLRQRPEIRDDHLRFSTKAQPQLFILRGDAHRTSVQMALARHHATNRQQRRRAKSKLIGAKYRCNQNVSRKFQASVHAERET